jgi:phospholipase/carboxylesterase
VIVQTIRKSKSEVAKPFILLHGLGSDEQDMLGFAQEIHPDYEVICVRAPLVYGPGFAWFNINWTPQGITFDESEYWTAVDLVAGLAVGYDRKDLTIGGFSQGAMITVGLMERFGELFSRAVLLSGRGRSRPVTFPGKIFQAHGLYDEVIDISFGRSLNKDLGDIPDYHEYNMGHSVCMEELDDLNRWLDHQAEG